MIYLLLCYTIIMLKVKTFQRNGKDRGPRSWFTTDPVEYLDMQVNEFCSQHKVTQILYTPPTDHSNRCFVVIYEDEK